MAVRHASRWIAVGGAATVLLACASGGSEGSVPTTHRSDPSTTVASTTTGGASVPCVMARRPGNGGYGGLAGSATITLPSGHRYAIRPGNPITAPKDVTLDGDGAAPGADGDANSLLWGAATPDGPFADLDHIAIGATITLDQRAPGTCTQHWRVVGVTAPSARSPMPRPSLTLVGFEPARGGPNATFHVNAVPA